jgi:cysteinyl-tRNA synthetase
VLWKKSSAQEPGWDSPWGRGRPGWHIECSAMSERYLGQVFDIHAGGLDLIFPHHENELAQSRCAHGTDSMARYWLHNGFLQVEGQKMSKSLGNFFTIRELLDTKSFGGRTWPGQALRLAMLKTHYRNPMDWTVTKLVEAERDLDGWSQFSWNQNHLSLYERELPGRPLTPAVEVVEALADDLNTPLAIARVFERRKRAPQSYETMVEVLDSLAFLGVLGADDIGCFGQSYVSDSSIAHIDGQSNLVRDYRTALANGSMAAAESAIDGLRELGINLITRGRRGELSLDDARTDSGPDTVSARISERLAALNGKDFAKADSIRAALLAEGIQLMDGKNDAGERITKWEIKR